LADSQQPANVYRRQTTLPMVIQRVAVLPVPQHRQDSDQAAGVEALEPVFLTELDKRRVFEIVPVSREDLRVITGGNSWSAEDRLPHEFFERLRQATGCDAVIFASLTTFQAYPPLRAGWKVRLVDCFQNQTWWAVDEVFDAGLKSTAAAAKAYARADLNPPSPLFDSTSVLYSPRRFGQFTANAVASTLPGR
jgi:hypothetical protein